LPFTNKEITRQLVKNGTTLARIQFAGNGFEKLTLHGIKQICIACFALFGFAFGFNYHFERFKITCGD